MKNCTDRNENLRRITWMGVFSLRTHTIKKLLNYFMFDFTFVDKHSLDFRSREINFLIETKAASVLTINSRYSIIEILLGVVN